MATTRTRILARALEMFNARGIESVGLRELAADLGLHVGNITYYFPTKDDLVNALALELNHLNAETFGDRPRSTLTAMLETLRAVFRNQHRYRCLMLSLVYVNTRHRGVGERHKRTQQARNDLLAADLAAIAAAGHLRPTDPAERAQLAETISLIARFWMSESAISYRRRDGEAQIGHYLSLVARLLVPYASPAGCAELEPYLEATLGQTSAVAGWRRAGL